MTYYYNWKEVEKDEALPKVWRRIIAGEKIMLVLYEMDPGGAEFPRHKHPHEQIGYVIQGKIDYTVGNERKVLGPGDGYIIPSNVEHCPSRVVGDKHVILLDVFYPIREEYLKKAKRLVR